MSALSWYKKQNIFGGKIHFVVLIIIAVSLPLSPFVLSMAQIWLALNYLLEGKYKEKISLIGKDKILWAFLLLPAVHLAGLINTSNFDWAGHDLLIKLPALSFPIILATTPTLPKKRLHIILWFFVAACFSGTVISMFVKAGYIPAISNDHRGISIFISHIRFSLMIVLALSFIITNLVVNYKKLKPIYIITSIVLAIWFLYFLGVLSVLISWVLLIILSFYITIHYSIRIKNIIARIAVLTSIILIPVLITSYVSNVYKNHIGKEINLNELPTHTTKGNVYKTKYNKKYKENGHFTYALICESELKEAWENRSSIPYSGKDKNGHMIRQTLIRYLTSRGFAKDYEGVYKLSDSEILAIENSITNYIYLEKSTVYIRIYETIWELDRYKINKNASKMSIPMRIEFYKAGEFLFKENFIWGTGTGDIKDEFGTVYDKINSPLDPDSRLRAHNQFLTFFITFGIIGGLLLIVSMIAPYIMVQKKSILLTCFFIIIIISMISEDTLETQAGITFYSLFYPMLIYNNKNLA